MFDTRHCALVATKVVLETLELQCVAHSTRAALDVFHLVPNIWLLVIDGCQFDCKMIEKFIREITHKIQIVVVLQQSHGKLCLVRCQTDNALSVSIKSMPTELRPSFASRHTNIGASFPGVFQTQPWSEREVLANDIPQHSVDGL